MLDQRRAKEQGYITLKEAAELANYTPDYVGQLIRAGKIKGEQVYSSVAWVTTKEEVDAYLSDKSRVVDNAGAVLANKQSTPYLTYGLVAIFAVAVLLLQYVLYVSLDTTLQTLAEEQRGAVTMHIVQ